MTVNSDYVEQLMKRFEPLPSIAARAVGIAVYSGVLLNTKQDSGEAAFNWRAQINNSQFRPYVFHRGRSPVGSTGDKRSAGFERFIVVFHRLNVFISRLGGKDIREIFIYNPIEDDEHEIRALIEEAGVLSTGEDFMEGVAQRALSAYL